jgi:hypothetical protein
MKPSTSCHDSAVPLWALTSPAVAEGEREIIDGPSGPVLVTKVAGTYYAVDATCPHVRILFVFQYAHVATWLSQILDSHLLHMFILSQKLLLAELAHEKGKDIGRRWYPYGKL